MSLESDQLRQVMRDAEDLADEVQRQVDADAANREASNRAVRERVLSQSAVGWGLLSTVAWAMQRSAEEIVPRVGEVQDEYTPLRGAFSLVHCNGSLIVQEIEVLLRNGFWAGGAARWRALHELAVTAQVLYKGGPDTAQRYLDHGYAVQVRRLHDSNGAPLPGPVPPDELARRWSESIERAARHATPDSKRPFHSPYEWAAPLIPRTDSGKTVQPTFTELERLVDQSKWRQLFRTANGLVHADSAGVATAVLRNERESIVGPSDDSVATVARPTFMSTQQLVATTLFRFEPKPNEFTEITNAWALALMVLTKRGADAFPPIYA